jgi:maltose alpha-D-glucosyltransferase/alpha-amylase
MLRTEAHGATATIAIAQAYVPSQGDGWAWTLHHLERLVDERVTPFADQERDGFEQYELFARQTGKRVGEMHGILARPSDNPSFTPEEIAPARASAIGTRVLTQLEAAIAAVRTARDSEALAMLGVLTERREELRRVVCQRAQDADGLLRTRIHGDLHLGQLLVAGEDVKIIDFEGEPARSLEERRRKYLPLRDLAGMLRSFSYAAAHASRANKQGGAEGKSRVDSILRKFLSAAKRGFLEGYAAGRGQALTRPEFALLDILMLEKAAYEVCYEAANRPTWLSVPLEGLTTLANAMLSRETADV